MRLGVLVIGRTGRIWRFFYDDSYDQTLVPVIPLGKAEAGAEELADTYGVVKLELVPEESGEEVE